MAMMAILPQGVVIQMNQGKKTPKYELHVYRQFIREASPYISLVAGRRIKASEADTMTDEQLESLAILIDERAEALNKNKPPWQG